MLAIADLRAMNLYMLMSPDNTIQPPAFVPNFVTGILFMNKADHTTYFGTNIEFIHGIHMLPLTPISPFIRQKTFVQAEWQAKFAGIINSIDSGWRGILIANWAIVDPTTAWGWLTTDFRQSWLDSGASLSWYLALTAGLAGGNPTGTPPDPTPGTAAPWDPARFYQVGDLVTYQAHTYKCMIAHHSQPDWTPTAAVSLWEQVS
jgi:endoglucanase Acf2